MKTYLTSYCNRLHCLDTGKPVDHECLVIPIGALLAERAGNYPKAVEILSNIPLDKRRVMVKGIRNE